MLYKVVLRPAKYFTLVSLKNGSNFLARSTIKSNTKPGTFKCNRSQLRLGQFLALESFTVISLYRPKYRNGCTYKKHEAKWNHFYNIWHMAKRKQVHVRNQQNSLRGIAAPHYHSKLEICLLFRCDLVHSSLPRRWNLKITKELRQEIVS